MTLERIANIALIVTCIGVSGHLAYTYFSGGRGRPTPAPYRAGERIADSAELGFKTERLTLLLATASTCHFCNESMPFYRKLVEASGGGGVRFVGVTHEDVETNRAYLRSNGVHVKAVISGRQNNIRVTGTPTLILVRRDGVVVDSWSGKLTPSRESIVTDAISKALQIASAQQGEASRVSH